ncbi:imidazole glycerol phosphate synthase subunit HisH [Kangiella sp.]|uniref:imidazole glycerol phosphate synthase subunit HisH n=1 Tax=Gammaproteobacteria TaxID=1236 RepID=UPI003A8DAC03
MVVVIDNAMGNAGSVLNMIKRAGGSAVISAEPDVIAQADKLLLPGVGAFDKGISRLKNAAFFPTLERKVLEGKTPFLGICLGMQVLFDQSEEGALPGLGWIKGNVRRFDFDKLEETNALKIPHMGWNVVHAAKNNTILPTDEAELRYYFVHSFHVECEIPNDVLAVSSYGYDFTCAVQHENIIGVQFHPEKSHRFGLGLMKNFIEW